MIVANECLREIERRWLCQVLPRRMQGYILIDSMTRLIIAVGMKSTKKRHKNSIKILCCCRSIGSDESDGDGRPGTLHKRTETVDFDGEY